MRVVILGTLALLALAAPAVGALPADTVHVSAAGFSFLPQVVTARVGEPVAIDGVLLGHTVTSAVSVVNAVQGQRDGTFHHQLPEGSSLTLVFDAPGMYTYYCALHNRSGMIGTILVE